jgi:2',3'-cyclic-nucleotide 2'-phosphodiesterase (5'-nucleotidase family)
LKEYEQCSLVFLVTHLGLAQQVNFANQPQLQGVDHILGADTHERVRQPIAGKYATVTEPGAFGSFVSRFDLVIEDGKVKDKVYQLLDVDPEKYKPDAHLASLIEKERSPYKHILDKKIGSSKIPLVRYYVLETPMDNMITDALMWKFKPDIALSNGFRFCPPLVPDTKTKLAEITMDYLWSMVPINGEIKSGEVLGGQLWKWLEQELHNVFAKNPAERFGGWVIRIKGMKLNFTMNNELGKRLNWVTVNDEPLDVEKFYKVCTCEREGDPDDVLCRLGSVKYPTLLNSDMHQTLIEYLKIHSPIAPFVEGRVTGYARVLPLARDPDPRGLRHERVHGACDVLAAGKLPNGKVRHLPPGSRAQDRRGRRDLHARPARVQGVPEGSRGDEERPRC